MENIESNYSLDIEKKPFEGVDDDELEKKMLISKKNKKNDGAGISDDEQDVIDDEDYERAIIANTPERLKTALTAKIRQIIADKLAFTAPSITATIEEGGSLYQAQFGYEQFGEWQGRILRKKLLKPADCPADNEDCVEHNTLPGNPHGNWDASRMIKRQSTSWWCC